MTYIERFRAVLPAAATFSKDPRCYVGDDNTELFATDGNGQFVFLNDDYDSYIDWVCSLGANILGYKNEHWLKAMHDAVDDGASFSLPTRLEVETAELLVDTVRNHVPGWSDKQLQVRFAKTGSECTEAAVRLARAVTGRDLVLKCRSSYLGWGNDWISVTPPAYGIPSNVADNIEQFVFNDECYFYESNYTLEQVMREKGFPACVILEQGLEDPNQEFYPQMRRFCDRNNTLLILDETASGFRYELGGAAERFNIMPDLVCYGKALGNGVAISALVGPKEYLSWFGRTDPVFVSGTFCGETLGLAGAKATLEFMRDNDVVVHLKKIGSALYDGLTDAFAYTPVKVIGHDVRSIIQWPSDEWHAFIVRGMLDNHIILNRPNYATWSHDLDDVEDTVKVARNLAEEWQKNGLPEYKSEQFCRTLFKNR
jgi:glutamate-1-semialdehyde 2,1-aminomutase